MANIRATEKDILAKVATLLHAEIIAAMQVLKLGGTALERSIEVQPKGSLLNVLANFYGQFVISGRKKFAKKVPISALIKWIKAKGLQGRDKRGRFISVNSLAWAIQGGIYKNGIKGRDFITPAVDRFLNEFTAETILNMLEGELDRVFEELTRSTIPENR